MQSPMLIGKKQISTNLSHNGNRTGPPAWQGECTVWATLALSALRLSFATQQPNSVWKCASIPLIYAGNTFVCFKLLDWEYPCIISTENFKKGTEFYSLESSAKRHSRDFTQLAPGHGACSFIRPSQLPWEHTAQLPFPVHRTSQTHKRSLSYQVPTYSWVERECARAKVPCLGAQCRSIIWPSWEMNLRSLAGRSCMLPLRPQHPQKTATLWKKTPPLPHQLFKIFGQQSIVS